MTTPASATSAAAETRPSAEHRALRQPQPTVGRGTDESLPPFAGDSASAVQRALRVRVQSADSAGMPLSAVACEPPSRIRDRSTAGPRRSERTRKTDGRRLAIRSMPNDCCQAQWRSSFGSCDQTWPEDLSAGNRGNAVRSVSAVTRQAARIPRFLAAVHTSRS